MRNIPLTESEKKRILSLHTNQNEDNNHILIEEIKSIKNLMKLHDNTNTFVLSESVNPKQFFESVPFLKPFVENMDEEFLKKTLQSLGDLSPTLQKQGISTIDELIILARQELEKIKKITTTELDDDILIIKRFFELNPALSKEIQDNIIGRVAKEIQEKTELVLKDFQEEINIVGGPKENELLIIGQKGDMINTQLNQNVLSEEGIETAITKLTELTQSIDETVKNINRDLTSISDKIKLKDATALALEKKYKAYLTELSRVKNILETQKKQLVGVLKGIQDIKAFQGSRNKIFYKGKEYDSSNLNVFHKAILNFNLDAFGTLSSAILRFVALFKTTPLRIQLVENITKLKELSNKIELTPTAELTREFAIYVRDTNAIIEQLNGKYFNMNYVGGESTRTLLEKIIKGGLTGYDTDTAMVWKEILGILNSEVKKGNITEAQSNDIINKILEVAGTKEDGKFVGVNDLSNLEGIVKFKYDLETLARQFNYEGLPQKFNEALTKIKSGTFTDDNLIEPLKKIWKELGGDLGSVTKKIFKGLAGVLIREFLFGLPLNIRYYLKPIAKFGINARSLVEIWGRLAISKAIGTVIFGGIDAMAYELKLKYLIEEGKNLDQNEIRARAWEEWNDEVKKYSNLDFGSILYEALPGFDFSQEIGQDRISGRDYIEKQNAEYGILDLNFVSFFTETWSLMFGGSLPTREEIKKYALEQEKKAERITNNKVNEVAENYQELFYSYPLDKQMERTIPQSDIWINGAKLSVGGFENLSPNTRNLLQERFFIKLDTYNGPNLVNLLPEKSKKLDVSNAVNSVSKDKILSSYGNIQQYTGYPCVCKKNLVTDNKSIKVGDDYIDVTIPVCDDFVRLIEFNDSNISDKTIKGQDNALGFTPIMKFEKVATKNWLPIKRLGEYIK